MTLHRVLFEGTVTGQVWVESDSEEEARKIADESPINIILYPTDWEITDVLSSVDQP